MGEFVPTSKGQGNLNTVLGTIGTLGTVAGAMSGCGGLFNNLFGGRNCNGNCGNCNNCGHCFGNAGQTYVDMLQAKVAELQAEKYSDNAAAEAYKASVAMAEKLDNKWAAQLGEVTREVADSRVREAELKGQLKCMEENAVLRQQIIEGKINEVALTANSGINTLAATVNCLANTLNQITKTVVPNAAVCPGWGEVNVAPKPATSSAA